MPGSLSKPAEAQRQEKGVNKAAKDNILEYTRQVVLAEGDGRAAVLVRAAAGGAGEVGGVQQHRGEEEEARGPLALEDGDALGAPQVLLSLRVALKAGGSRRARE